MSHFAARIRTRHSFPTNTAIHLRKISLPLIFYLSWLLLCLYQNWKSFQAPESGSQERVCPMDLRDACHKRFDVFNCVVYRFETGDHLGVKNWRKINTQIAQIHMLAYSQTSHNLFTFATSLQHNISSIVTLNFDRKNIFLKLTKILYKI